MIATRAAEDRMPPRNIQAEQATLGACLMDQSIIDDVFNEVTPEDFWRDDHEKIARTIRDLRHAGRTADHVAVVEEMRRRGQLDESSDIDLFTEFHSATYYTSTANAPHHAAIVRQHAQARRLISAAREIIDRGYAGQMSADDLAAFAEKIILAAGESRRTADLTTMADAVDDEIRRVLLRRDGCLSGIGTGFVAIDEMTGGFQPTNLVVLAARPGLGKSSLALNFAEMCVLSHGKPALFVSQEMGRGELAGRTLSSLSRVDHDKIRTGHANPGEVAGLYEVAATYRDPAAGPLWIDDQAGRTVPEIAAHARRLQSRHGLAIVFVDYLQLLESDLSGRSSRQEQVARISVGLKRLAMDLKIPVVALSQLNREVEGRDDHRPRLSDLRESGAIENDANIVLLLHQPEGESSSLVECIVAKNRNGPTGVVKLTFLKHLMRFENFAPDAQRPIPGEVY